MLSYFIFDAVACCIKLLALEFEVAHFSMGDVWTPTVFAVAVSEVVHPCMYKRVVIFSGSV
jgi:hypothetical protein